LYHVADAALIQRLVEGPHPVVGDNIATLRPFTSA
jgi:hypothetical protein